MAYSPISTPLAQGLNTPLVIRYHKMTFSCISMVNLRSVAFFLGGGGGEEGKRRADTGNTGREGMIAG